MNLLYVSLEHQYSLTFSTQIASRLFLQCGGEVFSLSLVDEEDRWAALLLSEAVESLDSLLSALLLSFWLSESLHDERLDFLNLHSLFRIMFLICAQQLCSGLIKKNFCLRLRLYRLQPDQKHSRLLMVVMYVYRHRLEFPSPASAIVFVAFEFLDCELI